MLEKTTRMNMLYDFYHSLLTNKQKEYMELYYREDYSLGEISEKCNVSRQAVYDNIRTTEQLLKTYEKKIQLYDKFLLRSALLTQLKEEVEKLSSSNKIIELIDDLQKID